MAELRLRHDDGFFLYLCSFLLLLCAWSYYKWDRYEKRHLPPGPPGEFLLGHLRIIPKENTAQKYAEWGKQYGSDIIYLKSLGQPIVVLNSVRAAQALLDQHGSNYCDRPRFTLFEVLGWRRTLTFMRFGPIWQMHRRLLQTTFSKSNVRRWHELQVREARRSVRDMVVRPDSWEVSLKRFAVAVVIKVSYGVDVVDDSDPYIQIVNDAMYALGNGGTPANSVVDMFPPARFLPNWLIRDWPLKFARKWSWAIRRLHDVPFAAAQKELEGGASNKSLAHRLLETYYENQKLGRRQEWSLEDIKGASGAVFIAGSDTTWATLMIFILNMVLHPEIQEKARDQLDKVVGTDRLPTLDDKEKLPFINDIIQETYRWSPLAPLGIPYRSMNSDTYDSKYFIPKDANLCAGAIVFANVRAMTQDDRVYSNPLEFDPGRYQRGEPYPVGNFGFGRRICVGRFLADNSVWIVAATMLATLTMGKKIGPDGLPIEPRVAMTNGGTCHPEHFECSLTPRSKKAGELLARSLL